MHDIYAFEFETKTYSVSWVLDLTWSHRRLVSTNLESERGPLWFKRPHSLMEHPLMTLKPYALRVLFKRHF